MSLGVLQLGAQVTHRPGVDHNLDSVPHIAGLPKVEL